MLQYIPLIKYLLRPYPGSQVKDAQEDKRIFNYRLSRTRRVSDNAFGILTQKFRIYQRRIKLKPENVDLIVMTTCILHHFIRGQFNSQDFSFRN